ncbi:protein of unknown function [Taphrina deformans PYCC 5710]|uniref:Uncharacterized protein n=1 Tax=Taphrina deformans (strain PYCC 5710 / ATCC 11124 / CBS 356.35 / IMI 108563 / JCM 9778 / NBRC 8474) TaxID=1097556 RepID=R4X8J4_TAPDE|nr:protein of unknown function [Taphrina deformans PYCC 5710]|eukprot:CCG81655.1 protein of unknown function [Taphrina deformans PYCC 5710]
MYQLSDQVRDMALDYADVHIHQKSRPRALCEFDGEKWSPIEVVDERQPGQMHPTFRKMSLFSQTKDSAYSSTAGSSVGHRSPELSSSSHRPVEEQSVVQADFTDLQSIPAGTRRSSSFQIPDFDLSRFSVSTPAPIHEEEAQYDPVSPHSDTSYETEQHSAEAEDILRDMIVQQRSESIGGGARRVSILASPSYQRNLNNFADLAISEVDLSEEVQDCDLPLARQHILSAFSKQFEAEIHSKQPLTTFSVHSRAEEYVEMLHVVLVLESRTVFWKKLGPSNHPIDKVTTLPYCWEADLDLAPLSLDSPRVTEDVPCVIMDRDFYSTIQCDNHNDECRKCKGLASQDDCFACDGTGIFKKKPCVMCSGKGQYFCKTCKNVGHVACQSCGSSQGPKPILRQAFITCTRETVVSPSIEVEGDNKISLITTARNLARETIEQEKFSEGTLPVAACGVLIRQRGHVICATDIKSGARGLFEVIPEIDRVEFKGQLAPVPQPTSRPASIRSTNSNRSTSSKRSSFFKGKKQERDEGDADDGASIISTTSSRLKNMFRRK